MLAKKILLALMAQNAYAGNGTDTNATDDNSTSVTPEVTDAPSTNQTAAPVEDTAAPSTNQTAAPVEGTAAPIEGTAAPDAKPPAIPDVTVPPVNIPSNITAGAATVTVEAEMSVSTTIGYPTADLAVCTANEASLAVFGLTAVDQAVTKAEGVFCPAGMTKLKTADETAMCQWEAGVTTGDGLTGCPNGAVDETTGLMTCACTAAGARQLSKRRLTETDVAFASSATIHYTVPEAEFEPEGSAVTDFEAEFTDAAFEASFKAALQTNAAALAAGNLPSSLGFATTPASVEDLGTNAAASAFVTSLSSGNFTMTGFSATMSVDVPATSGAATLFASVATFIGAALLF